MYICNNEGYYCNTTAMLNYVEKNVFYGGNTKSVVLQIAMVEISGHKYKTVNRF